MISSTLCLFILDTCRASPNYMTENVYTSQILLYVPGGTNHPQFRGIALSFEYKLRLFSLNFTSSRLDLGS